MVLGTLGSPGSTTSRYDGRFGQRGVPCGVMLGDVAIGVSVRGKVYAGGIPCIAEASTVWSLISPYVQALTRERDSKGPEHVKQSNQSI